MIDTEQKRIEDICKVANVDDIGEVSDGYHTFNQLYYQRMILFAALVKQNHDKAWKSLRHENGELCFGGRWFIVGIDTPEGSYTYHYEDKYFDLFDCETLDHGKHWDGHTEKDVTRLLSLKQEPVFFPPCQDCNTKMDEIRRAYDKLKKQEPCEDTINRILKRMWNCRGKHTTSIDKVAMEQIIRDELSSVNLMTDVLDKIEADIEALQTWYPFLGNGSYINKDDVKKIINKY